MLQTLAPTDHPTNTTGNSGNKTARIRALNDAFRQAGGMPPVMGKMLITSGVSALGPVAVIEIVQKVQAFDDFNEGNDPHGEHDFGSFDYAGQTIYWKIDYYSRDMERGSPDPADPSVTCRVLTVLLASEY